VKAKRAEHFYGRQGGGWTDGEPRKTLDEIRADAIAAGTWPGDEAEAEVDEGQLGLW
jgi:hypothetical protein